MPQNTYSRPLFERGLTAAVLIPLAIALSSFAARATTVIVPATTDIWLAGQPSGASVTGYFGTDFAPANSPIAIGAGRRADLFRFSQSRRRFRRRVVLRHHGGCGSLLPG